MSDFELADNWQEWPFEAKQSHLTNASAEQLRADINNIVGLPQPEIDNHSFTKSELAALLLALGGPQTLSED